MLGNRLLDHYLRGARRKPRFDVRAAISNCDPNRYGPVVTARSFSALHRSLVTLDLGGPQQTTSPLDDPRSADSDPVILSETRGHGCITTTLPPTPGVATYSVPITHPMTLIGLPRVMLRYQSTAPDLELNSRLWDEAPDGTQTLVTRGAYRSVGLNSGPASANYELFGNAWSLQPGHRLLLEITQDDATYLRADNFPSTTTITDARLTLPLR
jgi:hypothetical protein